MRKFIIRWWHTKGWPECRYEAAIEEVQESRRRREQELLEPYGGRSWDGHRVGCGCPGCQFMYAAEACYLKNGPPPLIGSFEPVLGDVARDPKRNLIYRTWVGDRWWPYDAALDYEEALRA